MRPKAAHLRSPLCLSHAEELACSFTHGMGAIFSVGALAVMLVRSAQHGTVWHVASTGVFGASLVLLYVASCLYHFVQTHGLKRVFQVLDHACIFILIAGTYTPFLLVNLRGPWGWSLFGIVWGIALVGIVLKAIVLPRYDKSTAFLYVAMGWLALVAVKPLLASLSASGFAWLVAGGASYTLGVVFFLNDHVKFAHVVWHLFVLGGSACHVLAVFHGVIPH